MKVHTHHTKVTHRPLTSDVGRALHCCRKAIPVRHHRVRNVLCFTRSRMNAKSVRLMRGLNILTSFTRFCTAHWAHPTTCVPLAPPSGDGWRKVSCCLSQWSTQRTPKEPQFQLQHVRKSRPRHGKNSLKNHRAILALLMDETWRWWPRAPRKEDDASSKSTVSSLPSQNRFLPRLETTLHSEPGARWLENKTEMNLIMVPPQTPGGLNANMVR